MTLSLERQGRKVIGRKMEKIKEFGEKYLDIKRRYCGIRGIFKRNLADGDYKNIRDIADKIVILLNKDQTYINPSYALLLVDMHNFVKKYDKNLDGIISGETVYA